MAALTYLAATLALRQAHRVAVYVAAGELAGVLTVGVWSVLDPRAFPDETVWSGFGSGYGWVPLVLPVVALVWLRRHVTVRWGTSSAGHERDRDHRIHRRHRAARRP